MWAVQNCLQLQRHGNALPSAGLHSYALMCMYLPHRHINTSDWKIKIKEKSFEILVLDYQCFLEKVRQLLEWVSFRSTGERVEQKLCAADLLCPLTCWHLWVTRGWGCYIVWLWLFSFVKQNNKPGHTCSSAYRAGEFSWENNTEEMFY